VEISQQGLRQNAMDRVGVSTRLRPVRPEAEVLGGSARRKCLAHSYNISIVKILR